jgi:hypothetical protein
MLGIRTADPEPPKQVGLVRAGVHAAGAVEHLADLDAATSSSSRAASMSETIRYRPWAEPGAAAVTFLPKMTEHPEPGGVNWITRKSLPLS